MSNTRMLMERRQLLKSLVALGAGAALARFDFAKAAEEIVVKTTIENLMAAFNGESNAKAKYTAFAKKADEEGYGKVASLFRAAAKAEEIHAKNHEAVIKKLGGKAKAEIKLPEIKTTKENLPVAIAGETYEFKTMYPAFLKKAKADKDRDAIRTVNFALSVEKVHAALYKEALDNLEAWKGANVEFYVCKECGNTVKKVDFEKCPICMHDKTSFIAVK